MREDVGDMFAALQIPVYRRLTFAWVLSNAGSLMTFIVFPLVIWDATGSATAFATYGVFAGVGTLLATPFGGVIADRFDRRNVMLYGDAIAAFGLLLDIVAISLHAWMLLYVLAFASQLVSALFTSAGPALRRDLVPDDLRVSAEAVTQFTQGIGAIVAPLVGAALYAAFGFRVVMGIDFATFLMSFALILGVRHEATKPKRAAIAEDGRHAIVRALDTTALDLRIGVRALGRDRLLLFTTLAAGVAGVGNGLLLTTVVPWVERTLHAPPSTWGTMITLIGAGGIAGAIVAPRIANRIGPRNITYVGCVLTSVGAAGYLGSPPVLVMFVATFVFGMSNVFWGIGVQVAQQRRVPSALQGRTRSLEGMIFRASLIAGTAAAGVLMSAYGTTVAMTMFAVCIFISSVLGVSTAVSLTAPVVLTDADADALEAPRVSLPTRRSRRQATSAP